MNWKFSYVLSFLISLLSPAGVRTKCRGRERYSNNINLYLCYGWFVHGSDCVSVRWCLREKIYLGNVRCCVSGRAVSICLFVLYVCGCGCVCVCVCVCVSVSELLWVSLCMSSGCMLSVSEYVWVMYLYLYIETVLFLFLWVYDIQTRHIQTNVQRLHIPTAVYRRECVTNYSYGKNWDVLQCVVFVVWQRLPDTWACKMGLLEYGLKLLLPLRE